MCGDHRNGSVADISQQLLDELPWNHFVQTFMLPRGWSLLTLVFPWTFLVTPAGWHFCLLVTCLDNLFGWIAMKFDTCVHGAQRMNPTDFSDPLAFPRAPPWGLHLCIWVKCPNSYWMGYHSIWYRHSPFPSGWIAIMFHLAPSSAQIFHLSNWFKTKNPQN